jgi:hypothetical protein
MKLSSDQHHFGESERVDQGESMESKIDMMLGQNDRLV